MPSQDPLEELAAAKARAKQFKEANKKAKDAKKLLASLTKAQASSKTAKKELEGESDE